MEFYIGIILGKLSMPGFLETRASVQLDLIISFLAFLPFLSIISIFLAIKEKLKLHKLTQFILFFLSLGSLVFFSYIVHYEEGFDVLLVKSSIANNTALIALSIHILISLTTLTLWMFALIYALSDRKRRGLPGIYSTSHAKAGRRVFKGIVLMTLSSVGIYWMLFMA